MSVPVALQSATDPRWFMLAVERWQELLLDHANCEKKAASTALALMFSYPEDFELADRMSRLAREELRHFELVQQQLTALQVPFRRLSPSRYAEGLRKALRQMSVGEYQLAGERIVVLVEGTAGGEQSKRHGDGVWQSAVWVG